jgi:Txe/YoeB family toxin of Txe-Axe toxin-antitoxin module
MSATIAGRSSRVADRSLAGIRGVRSVAEIGVSVRSAMLGTLRADRGTASGTGKPERLSRDLSGYRSRRIDQEHRLVHTVHGDLLIIVQARYHY